MMIMYRFLTVDKATSVYFTKDAKMTYKSNKIISKTSPVDSCFWKSIMKSGESLDTLIATATTKLTPSERKQLS